MENSAPLTTIVDDLKYSFEKYLTSVLYDEPNIVFAKQVIEYIEVIQTGYALNIRSKESKILTNTLRENSKQLFTVSSTAKENVDTYVANIKDLFKQNINI